MATELHRKLFGANAYSISRIEKKRHHGNQLLTDEDEDIVIGLIVTYSKNGTPIPTSKVRYLIESLLIIRKLPNPTISFHAAQSLIDRHSKWVKKKKSNLTTAARRSPLLLDKAQKFWTAYEDNLQYIADQGCHILNFDECWFTLKVNKSREQHLLF